MTRIAIVQGVRTPFVRAGGPLGPLPAQELGRIAVRELIERTDLDPETIDEVIFGNVAQPMEATNIARVIALNAGLPLSQSAHTVARNCASGLQSIVEAFEFIRSGAGKRVIAGGTESMSNIPLLFPKEMSDFLAALSRAKSPLPRLLALMRIRPRMFQPIIALLEGLKDPFCGLNMGQTAEVLAREFGITREEQDQFALESHRRAVASTESGRLREEIVPVFLPGGKPPIADDVGPRKQQTMEALTKLSPVFDRRYGSVTAGNSCGITDGAAALLIASEDEVRRLGVEPLAWIRSYAFAGLDPRRMGLGPAVVSPLALERAQLTMKDIGLVEINEAFAAQVLSVLKIFENPKLGEGVGVQGDRLSAIDPERLNPNGGAIALGHPVGSSGTRITLTLAHEMKRQNIRYGLATLCVGGGQGGAIILERP